EAAVGAADDPFQPGNLNGGSQSRAAHVFLQKTGKVSKPDAAIDRKPSGDLVLVFHVEGRHAAAGSLRLSQGKTAAIVRDYPKQGGILLSKARESGLEIVPPLHYAYRNFGSAIEGKPVVG